MFDNRGHAKSSLVVLRGVSPLNRKVANYTLKAFGCNWAYFKDNDRGGGPGG